MIGNLYRELGKKKFLSYWGISVLLEWVFVIVSSLMYMAFIFKIREPLMEIIPIIQEKNQIMQAMTPNSTAEILAQGALLRQNMSLITNAFFVLLAGLLVVWTLTKGVNWSFAGFLIKDKYKNLGSTLKSLGRRTINFFAYSLGGLLIVLMIVYFFLIVVKTLGVLGVRSIMIIVPVLAIALVMLFLYLFYALNETTFKKTIKNFRKVSLGRIVKVYSFFIATNIVLFILMAYLLVSFIEVMPGAFLGVLFLIYLPILALLKIYFVYYLNLKRHNLKSE